MTINKTSALGDSPVFLGTPGDLEGFRLACMIVKTEMREDEPPGADAQVRRRVLSVVDTTPVLAKSTAGIGPAGEAERAMAAKSEALVLGARRGWARSWNGAARL